MSNIPYNGNKEEEQRFFSATNWKQRDKEDKVQEVKNKLRNIGMFE